MLKITYITIIISFIALRVQSQEISYQPLIFNNIIPVWQHAPIDSSLIGINNFDGRNQFTKSKNPSCYVLFEDNLYIAPSTATTNYGIDGGQVERINPINGEVDWIYTFDLRTEERQEVIQDLYIDDQRRLNVVSFRRIVAPKPDPYLIWLDDGDSSLISIRKFDIETGYLIEHITPSLSDHESLRLKHQMQNSRFFKGDKNGNFQFIEKVTKSGFVLKQYLIDENGHQIQQMNEDTIRFNAPNSGYTNHYQPVFIVSKDTILVLSHVVKQDPLADGQSRLTIYDKDLKKRREYFLDDLIGVNYGQIYIENADNRFIKIMVDLWRNPWEPFILEHIILDYEGNIVKRFMTTQNGTKHFTFKTTYLESENEFLVVGVTGDRSFRLNFFKTKGFDELEKIKTIGNQNPEYFFSPTDIFQLPDGDILLNGINIFWPADEDLYQGNWPTLLKFNAEDIGLTSTKETENVCLLRIYPNPASDRVTISLEEDQSGVIDILDHMGREIYITVSETQGGSNQINIGYLPTGMYFVRVTDKTGRIRGTGRFVKMF